MEDTDALLRARARPSLNDLYDEIVDADVLVVAREAFPRLYFVSDRILLHSIAYEDDPQKLLKDFFVGVIIYLNHWTQVGLFLFFPLDSHYVRWVVHPLPNSGGILVNFHGAEYVFFLLFDQVLEC